MATVMINGFDVSVVVSEPVAAVADEFDLVIHALQGSVGDPQVRPGQDAVQMLPDQAGEIRKWRQPRVTGPPQPLAKMLLCPVFGNIIPEPLEVLFEVPRPRQGMVASHQRAQRLLLWLFAQNCTGHRS